MNQLNLKRKKMRTRIERIEVHSDARGYVFEPIEKNPIVNQKNVHVVISEPGAIRGNHFHKNGTEIIAVIGPALMRLKETEKLYDIEVPEGDVHRFTIPRRYLTQLKIPATNPISSLHSTPWSTTLRDRIWNTII